MAVEAGVAGAGDADRRFAILQAFLTEWRRLQPPAAPPLTLRLQTFVEAWRSLPRPCLPRAGAAKVRDELSAERLAEVLSELKPALDRAKASGAFVNVWRVAGLGRKERRAADALAWLLEPVEITAWAPRRSKRCTTRCRRRLPAVPGQPTQ